MQGQIDFYKIVEALGDGVICVNEDNRIQYINKRAIEIIDVRSFPCIGGKICMCFNVCTPLAGSIIQEIIEEVRNTGYTRGLEKDAFICNLADEKIFVAASLSKIEMVDMKLIVINFREINKIKKLQIAITN